MIFHVPNLPAGHITSRLTRELLIGDGGGGGAGNDDVGLGRLSRPISTSPEA